MTFIRKSGDFYQFRKLGQTPINAMINVFIGLMLVFLLYSLLATTIMELLSGLLSMRGKNLEKAIKNMLHTNDGQFFQSFRDNALYRQLAGRNLGKNSPPSYLSSEKFRSILFHLVEQKPGVETLKQRLEALPEGSLRDVLLQLLDDAGEDLEAFKQKVELWFNDVMDRASGWYKRNIQIILVFLGMAIAVVFNVDTVRIYTKLSQDPELSAQVAQMAEITVQQTDSTFVQTSQDPEIRQLRNDLITQTMTALQQPLGIGWKDVDFEELKEDPTEWLIKLLGWLITAMAVSLGAPFWFDMLKRIVNIRSSGNAPK